MFGTLIAGLATGEVMNSLQRLKKALVSYSIAGICLLVGLIFLIISGTIWLARRFGAIETTAVIGGAFVILAILVLVVHRLSSRARIKVSKRRRGNDLRKAAIATGIAVLPTLLSGRAGRAMLLAPAVGALAYALYRENSSKRRRPGRDEDSAPDKE